MLLLRLLVRPQLALPEAGHRLAGRWSKRGALAGSRVGCMPDEVYQASHRHWWVAARE